MSFTDLPVTAGAGSNYLRGFDINGDMLSNLFFLPNNFLRIDDSLSRALATDIAAAQASTSLGPAEQFLIVDFRNAYWAPKIHGVDLNYLELPEGLALTQQYLGELDDECGAGKIVSHPTTGVTVSLADSIPVTFDVFSRTGGHLDGRAVRGGGPHSSVTTTGWLRAMGPVQAEPALFTTAPWGSLPLGSLAVTIPSVPFPGHIYEHLSTRWIASGGGSASLPGDTIAPPVPGSTPGWNGVPSGCVDTTITYAGPTRWTKWGLACTRTYTVEIPANPLPGGARIRVSVAPYPTGPFNVGSISAPLPRDSVVVDTLTQCGVDYCVRAAILDGLTAEWGLLDDSDTLCFSDLCGGASTNRVPVVHVLPARVAPNVKRNQTVRVQPKKP